MAEKFLTVADVAERFQVDRKTVRRWVHAGQLEVTKWSAKGWRFREAAIEAFANRHTLPADPAETKGAA